MNDCVKGSLIASLGTNILAAKQVFGESRVNVHALFEQLRREGDLTLVGAEAAISENKWKRYVLQAPLFHASSVVCHCQMYKLPWTGKSFLRSCRMTYGNGLSSPAASMKDIQPQAEIHLQVRNLSHTFASSDSIVSFPLCLAGC